MEKCIGKRLVLLWCGMLNNVRMLLASEILHGEGLVVDCRLKNNTCFGIFSPQAMAFCEKIPEEHIYLVTIEFKGGRYTLSRREFFCIGKKVKVTYRKGICGIMVENIQQLKHCLYH